MIIKTLISLCNIATARTQHAQRVLQATSSSSSDGNAKVAPLMM
jgi:hypothetical protein